MGENQEQDKKIDIITGNIEALKLKLLSDIAQQLKRIANALEAEKNG